MCKTSNNWLWMEFESCPFGKDVIYELLKTLVSQRIERSMRIKNAIKQTDRQTNYLCVYSPNTHKKCPESYQIAAVLQEISGCKINNVSGN